MIPITVAQQAPGLLSSTPFNHQISLKAVRAAVLPYITRPIFASMVTHDEQFHCPRRRSHDSHSFRESSAALKGTHKVPYSLISGSIRNVLIVLVSSANTPYDASMPGAWPVADNYHWEVNQDGGYSVDPSPSPGAGLPQPSTGTLSPLAGMFDDFSLGDQLESPGIFQETFPDEPEYQYNDGTSYPTESRSRSHHAPPPTLESTPSLFAHHSLFSASVPLQDSWRPAVGVSGQRGPTQNNFLFPTDDSQLITYHWQYYNSTPSSSFTSPTIETPLPLPSDISSLPNSPYNRSPSLTDGPGYASSLIIPRSTTFSSHSNAYLSSGTLSTEVRYEQYNDTGSAGPSHPTSAIDDTMLSPFYALQPSHATPHSAPPSPSVSFPYRQSISVEQGTRRHSDSSGSDYPQEIALVRPELARFRRDAQAGMHGRDTSTSSMRPDQHAASQMHLTLDGPVLGDGDSPRVVLKNTIASTATLTAANKRRKKNPLFPCNFCPQRLTSQDNLRSGYRCFLRELRNLTPLQATSMPIQDTNAICVNTAVVASEPGACFYATRKARYARLRNFLNPRSNDASRCPFPEYPVRLYLCS